MEGCEKWKTEDDIVVRVRERVKLEQQHKQLQKEFEVASSMLLTQVINIDNELRILATRLEKRK